MIAIEYVLAALVAAALVVGVVVTGPSDDQVVTEPTFINEDGVCCTIVDGIYVPADPAGLAKGMGYELGPYALARVMESEAGSLPWIGQVGVAWVVRNHAAKKGRSVAAVITRATLDKGKEDGAGDGYFGRQGDPVGGYRYVASSRDPSADQVETARAILADEIDDPTEGALNFDSPQSYGKQSGTDESGADAFAENRESEGKVAFALPGISMSRLRLWRPA